MIFYITLMPPERQSIIEEARVYLYKGRDLCEEGKYSEAICELDKALAINENLILGYYFRGMAYGAKDDCDQAIENWTAALRIDPNFTTALHNRGISYYNKGSYDQAIEDWEAVLRIDPNNPNTKKIIERARQTKVRPKSSGLDIFSSLSGVMIILKLGFVPEDEELYELTPEQYQHYYATEENAKEHLGEKMYMILPKNSQKYVELASEDVFVLREEDVILMRKAEEFIENYCTKSEKEFNSFEEKLCYCASVMPSVVSKGTKYERK